MALIFRFSCPSLSNDYRCTLSFLYQVWWRTWSHGKMWWDKRAELSGVTGGNIASLVLSVPTFPQCPQHPQCLPESPVSPRIPSLPLPSETGCPMLPISCLHRWPLTQTSYGLLQGKRERSERSSPHIHVFQISLTSNTWRGELPYSRLLCFEHCQQIKGRWPPPWFWLQL